MKDWSSISNLVTMISVILSALLDSQLGGGVGNFDLELLRSLDNNLPGSRRNVVSDLCAVLSTMSESIVNNDCVFLNKLKRIRLNLLCISSISNSFGL